MLLITQTTLALRCPRCGKMDFYALSRFNCNGKSTAKINCECGAVLLSYCQKGKGLFRLQIDCGMCEAKHVRILKAAELWNAGVLPLKCESTGVEIGFIGPKEAVLKNINRIDRSLREIAEELGYDKYFINPEIMYQVLELLRKIADEGQMSCGCGSSHLEVEVYPDRVEMLCPDCDAVGIVFAETVKDLQWVHDMGQVHLEAQSYQYLDRKRIKKKSRVKKTT